MDDLISRGQIIENAINSDISNSKLTKIKQQNFSMMGLPLLRNLSLSNLVPPALHIILSAVNTIIFDYVNKREGDDNALFEAILKLNVRVYHPGNTFAGNETRKILNFIRGDGKNLEAFGVDLLKAVAKIEPFAVARDLTEAEIDGLEAAIDSFFELIKEHHPNFPNQRPKLHS
uniref:Uncharacterized protein n=1 Tax=Panagrolaimus sp. ES5 TaxID=591445 RepID=A0AC34FHS0_9BILA